MCRFGASSNIMLEKHKKTAQSGYYTILKTTFLIIIAHLLYFSKSFQDNKFHTV